MRTLIHVAAGIALAISGWLLLTFARMRARSRRALRWHGITEPVPLPPAAWLVVAIWAVIFIAAGIILAVA